MLVYRPTDADVEGGRLAVGLGALEAAIVALGAKNWTLLVVCRAADMVKMPPPSANREYRCVRDFNPREHVTWAELGDPVGWNAIFSEFAPAKVLPKAHAFKFE